MRLVNKRRFAIFCSTVVLIILVVTISNIKSNKTVQTLVEVPRETYQVVLAQHPTAIETTLLVEEPKKYYDIPLSPELQEFTKKMCEKYDVTFEVILGIMKVESDFDHNNSTPNDSENGSSNGILQLNTNRQSDIKWYGEITNIEDFDPNNVYHNIEGGIAVYKSYKTYWEKQGYTGEELIRRSCNSYNCGIAGYKKYIRNTGKISRGYDKAVINYKNKLITGDKMSNIRYQPMKKAGSNIRYIDNLIKDTKMKTKEIKRRRLNVDKAVEDLLDILK